MGKELKCPECGLDLEEIKGNGSRLPWKLVLMIGIPAIIIILIGIFVFWPGETPKKEVATQPTTSVPEKPKAASKPLLTGLKIKGSATVEEKHTANYVAMASYKESGNKEVAATWSVSPNTYASISPEGMLTALSVPADQKVTVTAEYKEGRVTQKDSISVAIKKKGPSVEEMKKLSAELNFQQGMNYIQNEDYGNAIKEFTAAINKYPKYAIAYSNRAVAYMQQKKYNIAAEDLEKAEKLSPQDANIYYNLTALYSLQKKLDLALNALDKALELGFNNYDSLRKDPDLKNLRKHAEFQKVLEKHKIFLK